MIYLLLASAFWGITNPFLRKGTIGLEKSAGVFENQILQMVYELYWLFTRWHFSVPFVVNQFGSYFFLLSLSENELSFASPFVNALTFVITAIVSRIVDDVEITLQTLLGLILVLLGITIMSTVSSPSS
jgi:multidrug transporter EmrE-like cation transporter